MSSTTREIARRFTEFGGPSFFVSFLGQESLSAPVDLNVTFDRSLDWDVATPELAFWDVGMYNVELEVIVKWQVPCQSEICRFCYLTNQISCR